MKQEIVIYLDKKFIKEKNTIIHITRTDKVFWENEKDFIKKDQSKKTELNCLIRQFTSVESEKVNWPLAKEITDKIEQTDQRIETV